ETSTLLPTVGALLDPAAAQRTIIDPAVRPAQAELVSDLAYAPQGQPVLLAQPVNWISGPYLKPGFAMALGGDLLGDAEGGYAVSGGYRVPWGPAFDERLFLDFGGSYLSAYGTETRAIAGTSTTIVGGVVVDSEVEADLFDSTLREIKRGTVHAAIGWYWGDPIDVRSDDPQLRFATRLGGRWGHVRGRFEEVANRAPGPNEVLTYNYYGKTDTIGGLYVGAEAVLLTRNTAAGSIAWTLDAELANDWIEFGGWDRGSLGTAAITLGVMLSR
ncbi:MAG TPA: hypothetical protein PJ982_13050, partial [Lacipirellulaceae bacterium]|nr:hypothetical protein [Lacipirellulaceae bacterium]